MKFGGDPSEYGEFVVNFRDHIESQVSDDSQRLTCLLAQCVGRVKEKLKAVLTRDTVKPGKLCLRILDSLTWWLMLI